MLRVGAEIPTRIVTADGGSDFEQILVGRVVADRENKIMLSLPSQTLAGALPLSTPARRISTTLFP